MKRPSFLEDDLGHRISEKQEKSPFLLHSQLVPGEDTMHF